MIRSKNSNFPPKVMFILTAVFILTLTLNEGVALRLSPLFYVGTLGHRLEAED